MREIKFRAWDKADGVMWQWPALISSGFKLLVDPAYIVMQYIDHKDRNDTEIYAGDVLSIGKHTLPRAVVVWNRDGFVFEWDAQTARIRQEKTYHGIPANINCWHIIGNIHENPELVE